MLKRDRRISREVLKTLIKPALFVNSGVLSARVFLNKADSNKESKFSFSVSKKVEKKATLRNKMRRLGYDVVRVNLDNIKEGFLVRFVFNSKPPKTSFVEDIEKDVLNILNKANIISI